uniref:NADH dehydrogenase subunit 6 n=1 Tax=Navis striatus TaxID=1580118 RepID=UPI000739167F|nr:NADH dehydrogenase subunit 6 [Navis striatus]AIZ58463.1 NADH dehydrogenase subunit 6 [Navis striatus]AIZ58476.1 NADH dehydrogenase subunit 6 [Navis striatus]QLD97047.1 NADH dehydrogenase subunit 6 [Navis striatus]
MKFMVLISLFFLLSTHPLTMIFLLVIITFLTAFMMYLTMKSTWFSLILILLILGGMLVLFIYITSLTPNQKFTLNKKNIFLLLLPMLMHMNNKMQLTFSKENIYMYNMNNNSLLLIFITTYLLITLIAIMKLINSTKGPLRLSN